MVRLSFSILRQSHSSTGSLTETFPVGWTREPAKGLSSEDETLKSNSGIELVPTHERHHPSDCLLVISIFREVLVTSIFPVEVSVWGARPVINIHWGTGLTLQVIVTVRLQSRLTSTRKQNLRTCTGSLNRLGGRPCTGSLKGLGGILLFHISTGTLNRADSTLVDSLPHHSCLTGGLIKAGTGAPNSHTRGQASGGGSRIKKRADHW